MKTKSTNPFGTAVLVASLFILSTGSNLIWADEPDPANSEDSPLASEAIQLPDIGIRMTPEMLSAIPFRFAEAMQENLELDQQQTTDIEKILKTNLTKLTNDNAETGRDIIETMMATMIRNDGRFPKEDAVRFGKQIKPLLPALCNHFTETSAEIGKTLNFKQRVQFSTTMGAFMGGFSVFEQRMARWEEGKVGDNANPFWEPGDREPEDGEKTPEDPNEHPEHRKARQEVERWSDWEMRVDEAWGEYLKHAADFYEFDDAQRSSAESVLKQCKDRASAIKSPEWREKSKQNRIAKRLARRGGEKLGEGPIVFALDREYNQMRKPLQDLDEEFKRRIDELPTSKQRQAAKQKIRKFLTDRGMKQPPV